jgi:hypothetical protein
MRSNIGIFLIPYEVTGSAELIGISGALNACAELVSHARVTI